MKTILGNERILQFERKLKKWFNKTNTKNASYIFKGCIMYDEAAKNNSC